MNHDWYDIGWPIIFSPSVSSLQKNNIWLTLLVTFLRMSHSCQISWFGLETPDFERSLPRSSPGCQLSPGFSLDCQIYPDFPGFPDIFFDTPYASNAIIHLHYVHSFLYKNNFIRTLRLRFTKMWWANSKTKIRWTKWVVQNYSTSSQMHTLFL